MKKSDIYKLINYNGEYNANVKKALRKLLKEHHPDHKGNREIFELINEVKKELESGKPINIKKEEKKVHDNIDYDYYYRIINELKNKKNSLNETLNAKKRILNEYEKEYKELYEKSINLESDLLVNTPLNKKVKDIRLFSIIFLVLMIIIFALSVLKNSNILFIIFVILSLFSFVIFQNYLVLVHKTAEKSKKSLNNYVKMNSDIKENTKKQNVIKKEIRDIKRKIVNIENDLRFYKNLLK